MESKLKSNINTVGLVGYILSIILIVGIICAMVANAIGIAAAAAVSKEKVDVKISSNVNITSEGEIFSKLNKFIGIDGIDDLSELSNGGVFAVNDGDISSVGVSQNDNGYVVDVQTETVSFTAARLIAGLVVSFVYLASILVILYMLKALMKSLKSCDSPFAEDVVKKLERFGYSLIPYAVISMISDGFWGNFMMGGKYELTFNLTKIFIVLFVFVLCLIFKYGAELQRQSDETL